MKLFLPVSFATLLPAMVPVAHTQDVNKESALKQAQALKAPEAKLSYAGETENNEWWEAHEELLREARLEWGRKHPELYSLNEGFADNFLDPDLVRAIRERDKELFASLFEDTDVPLVYRFRLFTPEFTQMLLEELDHHEESGIPIRRPNGMNRYGASLSDLGFSDMVNALVNAYLVPAARHLFPEYVGPNDITHNYPFTVRYKPGQDISLAEHADASLITVNVCLQPDTLLAESNKKVLYFKELRTLSRRKKSLVEPAEQKHPKEATYLELAQPGQALVHLGQHIHGVSPVEGSRGQMVIWLFGEWGVVRVAPYESQEVEQHVHDYDTFWKKPSTQSKGADKEL